MSETDPPIDTRPEFVTSVGGWGAIVLVLGIGYTLSYRWNEEHVETVRSRYVTVELLRDLGSYALLDYVDAHECLPKSVDDLVP